MGLSIEVALAARDQFPVLLPRAAYQSLARAYLVLGQQQQAAEALQHSGLGPAATDGPPMFTSFSLTARDGMRLSAPGALRPAPGVHVARSYDFGDFAFIETSAGVVAIDLPLGDRLRANLGWNAGASLLRINDRWAARLYLRADIGVGYAF